MSTNLYFYTFNSMSHHEIYMQRCFQLAALGAGFVAPNPQVGAVLVYQDRIIGEGYHAAYGGPHAEVHCIHSVTETDKRFISASTLYVSLEPCNHFGKTPPCSKLILEQKIPRVVISVTDPFEAVNGSAIKLLSSAGVEVTTGILEKEGRALIAPFYTFHTKQRPYIILKWAQTADGFMAGESDERIKISNHLTDILVHRWRSEVMAIAVGTQTALKDNPKLNTRYWPGKNPIRVLIDRTLKVPEHYQLLHDDIPTIVMNATRSGEEGAVQYIKVDEWEDVHGLMQSWYHIGLQSILIEGGAKLITSFIRSGEWDEIRVITNTSMQLNNGLKAPDVSAMLPDAEQSVGTDIIRYYRNKNQY